MKSDLWKYLVLYKYGGIYLDADMDIYKPFKKWQNYPFEKYKVI